jgi:hypothetical protein
MRQYARVFQITQIMLAFSCNQSNQNLLLDNWLIGAPKSTSTAIQKNLG